MNKIKITYGITVCNEIEEIKKLLSFLREHKRMEDEILILMDKDGKTKEVEDYVKRQGVRYFEHPLNNDFAQFKNQLIEKAEGDYLFQIDADELPSPTLVENLHSVLELNPKRILYAVPRVNTVEGLTQEHIRKWRWRVDVSGYVNYPDYQLRIFKLGEGIKWRGNVHEVPGKEGVEVTPLPSEYGEWALFHPKTIERQEKQNEMYSKM